MGRFQPCLQILDRGGVEVSDIDKHSSLLRYVINYARKRFYDMPEPLSAVACTINVLQS